MESDGRTPSWRWPLLFSVVFLNICLPSLVLSYGSLLVHLVELEVPLWLSLSTPTILILTYSLTKCWCREAADSWGGSIGYRVMASIGLAAVVVNLFVCAWVPYYWQPFIYGILGGSGFSLISAQVDAVIFDSYDSRLGLIRSFCFAGQAIGQCIFPHILTALIGYYEYSYSYIVLSGIMLQTLPAIMLLKIDDTTNRPVSFSRYSDLSKTYSIFNNENKKYYSTDLQLHDLSKKCWKSPADDNLHRELENEVYDAVYENIATTTVTPPPSPEEKRRNIFGVEILPQIPEESEESDEEGDNSLKESDLNKNKTRLSVAIKRLSILGDNLDDCISNQVRIDSQGDQSSENRDYTEVEVTYENISPVTDIQREKIFNSFSFKCQSAYASIRRSMWMPSYRIYRIRRRTLFIMYFLSDTLIKPLSRSLSFWKFYPSLLLVFTKLSLTAIFLPVLPIIAARMHPKVSTVESNFLMSLYAFTWLCFLLCTPWLTQMRKKNYQWFALVGLVISTVACFITSHASNPDTFSIGVVVAGFGYGAISSCWETTVQDFVGARKWPKIQSTLETLGGCLLSCFMIGISFIIDEENGLQCAIFILGLVLFIITVIWTVIAAFALYVTKLKSIKIGRRRLK